MSGARDLPRVQRVRYALLGLAAVTLFVAALATTWTFLKGGFRQGTPVTARFSERGVGQQLPVNGDVKVRGVLVGTISDVELTDDGTVVVRMLLNDEESLDERISAEIRSKAVFGQKWIELIPPAVPSGRELVAGSEIPDERTREPLELERELQLGHELLSELPLRDLSTVLETLAQGFGGRERDARAAIDQGLVALKAVNARSEELDLSLRQLRELSEWLDANDDDALAFMSSLDSANRALVGAAPEFRASLASVPRFLNDFARFQELTEEDLGRLVEDGASVAEVLAARSADLEDIVVELEPFTTVWNSGLSQPCRGVYESNMTCWQVYQMPGTRSRGLYGRSPGPAGDESSDPLSAGDMTTAQFRRLLARYADGRITLDLARLLFTEARSFEPGVSP